MRLERQLCFPIAFCYSYVEHVTVKMTISVSVEMYSSHGIICRLLTSACPFFTVEFTFLVSSHHFRITLRNFRNFRLYNTKYDISISCFFEDKRKFLRVKGTNISTNSSPTYIFLIFFVIIK